MSARRPTRSIFFVLKELPFLGTFFTFFLRLFRSGMLGFVAKATPSSPPPLLSSPFPWPLFTEIPGGGPAGAAEVAPSWTLPRFI